MNASIVSDPTYDGPGYLMDDQAALDALGQELFDLLRLFPKQMQKAHPQLIASVYFGYSAWSSDLDINFTTEDDQQDEANRAMWYGAAKLKLPNWRQIYDTTEALERKYRIRLFELSFGLSAKPYCYDFADRKLYGKAKGLVLNLRRKFDLTTKRYEVSAYSPVYRHGRITHA